MQAQEYPMAKWAVGVRLKGVTDADVESALDRGEIIRTHVLRPTWHLVTAEDLRWMVTLTAPNIRKLVQGRHRDLGLTSEVLSKSYKVIEKILRDGNHATRDELIPALNKANITTDENRASHIFMSAELELLICSGKTKNGKQTFSLVDEWVQATQPISRDEALASLAQRYFQSHNPAQVEDFVWWSGLSVKDAKTAIEMVKRDFVAEVVEDKTFWVGKNLSPSKKDTAFLFPAYDEFLISYADRSATLTFENHKRTVSVNGIFRATVVVNGQTIGVWKRTFKKGNVLIEFEYFTKPDRAALKLIENAAARYAKFLGMAPVLL
jgi:hypothetical protein